MPEHTPQHPSDRSQFHPASFVDDTALAQQMAGQSVVSKHLEPGIAMTVLPAWFAEIRRMRRENRKGHKQLWDTVFPPDESESNLAKPKLVTP
jgi:hypothetical protein